jgi:hypothetical protein
MIVVLSVFSITTQHNSASVLIKLNIVKDILLLVKYVFMVLIVVMMALVSYLTEHLVILGKAIVLVQILVVLLLIVLLLVALLIPDHVITLIQLFIHVVHKHHTKISMIVSSMILIMLPQPA